MKLLLLMLTSWFCVCWSPRLVLVEKWRIEKDSNLYFEGKSNVSSFRCGIASYLRPDTLCFYRDNTSQQVLTVKGGLSIDVKGFECQQSYMKSDLQKTLKVNECPVMKISLLSIGNFSGAMKNTKGTVAITLAGVTRTMDVEYTVLPVDNANIRLYGKRQVLFADFGLTPPRKLAGLVKVEEQINVNFLLALRSIK